MRVVLIFLQRKGSGTLYSLNMAKELHKSTQLTCVISSDISNKNEWYSENLNIVEMKTFHNSLSAIFSLLNFNKFHSLKKQINTIKPDVIYYPMLHLWIPLLNLLFYRINKIYTMHDPVLHVGDNNYFLQKVNFISAKTSNKIVLLSKALIDKTVSLGLPRNKIEVIPHGEYSYYTKYSSNNTNERTYTILFFGRISRYKGIDILLKSYRLLKNKVDNVKLLIVGSGDLSPYSNELSSLPDVTIVNRWIEDNEVANFFEQADILVAPYIDASQSGVIPTAYAFSKPVITTNIAGLIEQVDHGKTGFIVSVGDYVEISDRCAQLLTDDDLFRYMSKEAYLKSAYEMSWETSAKKLFNIIESIRG